jgi:hypothetical protein
VYRFLCIPASWACRVISDVESQLWDILIGPEKVGDPFFRACDLIGFRGYPEAQKFFETSLENSRKRSNQTVTTDYFDLNQHRFTLAEQLITPFSSDFSWYRYRKNCIRSNATL